MSSKLDLHEALRRNSYDHAVFCTFNFQPDFFEEYCLEHFKSLETNNNITVIMDGRELDRLVAGPSAQWPKQANTRYLLHAARPKGRFHPKLFLLASQSRGLLVVGSANLTRPGLTRNSEMARAFTFEVEKHESLLPLFQAARAFLGDVAKRWPSTELDNRLQDLDGDAAWLSGPAKEPPPIRLLHNLTTPLLQQLKQGLSSPVHEVLAISPFFDEQPTLLDWVARHLDPRVVSLFTKNGAPSLTPAWLDHPMMKSNAARLLFSEWNDREQTRQLHAKAIAIRHANRLKLAYGSANFTRAAMLSTPEDGNVEVVLVLDDMPADQIDVRDLFDPSGSAKSEPLLPHRRPPEKVEQTYSLRLVEASLEDTNFRCTLSSPHDCPLACELLFLDGGAYRLELTGVGTERRAEVEGSIARRANRGSTIVFLSGPGGLLSNRVLLLNLQDLESGESLRKGRRVRDAEKSASQFAEALKELLRLKDTDPLQSFLTHCDIPLAGASRFRRFAREPFTLGQIEAELRPLGIRNLREYRGLQEAVLGFCDRHISRLTRHARGATIDTIPGCMHIVRSVAGVLATQIERMLSGLSCVESLSNDGWFDVRTDIDDLLNRWLALMNVVATGWLPSLKKVYPLEEIKSALIPDMESYRELARGFGEVRVRVLADATRFRVETPSGQVVEPPIVEGNVLHASAWRNWAEEVSRYRQELEAAAG